MGGCGSPSPATQGEGPQGPGTVQICHPLRRGRCGQSPGANPPGQSVDGNARVSKRHSGAEACYMVEGMVWGKEMALGNSKSASPFWSVPSMAVRVSCVSVLSAPQLFCPIPQGAEALTPH